MRFKNVLFFIIFLFVHLFNSSTYPASLVHNAQKEIDSCMGKVKLKLVRNWGGDEENDEHNFFRYPYGIVIDKNDKVYISDLSNFNVKVFGREGKYIRTIGRKGRGPGDLIGPGPISIAPDGMLWVGESGGRRLQAFNMVGKSQIIIKHNERLSWLAVTNTNEIAVHSHYKTFNSRALVSIYSTKGKLLREIGKYHDPSKTLFGSEYLFFAKDNQDHILVANTMLPVIRKYSLNGRLTDVITYDTPFFIPVKVALNAEGNEITRIGDKSADNTRVRENKNGYTFDYSRKKGKWKKVPLCNGLHTGPGNNLYLVTSNREVTEKEKKATLVTVIGEHSNVDRSTVDHEISENTDIFNLYVFNPKGKIIAGTKLMTFCDKIYISGNRLFVVDGSINQRILEYEIKILP